MPNYGSVYSWRVMPRQVSGPAGAFFSLLTLHVPVQQKAVTHKVCNGFSAATEYDKESFG